MRTFTFCAPGGAVTLNEPLGPSEGFEQQQEVSGDDFSKLRSKNKESGYRLTQNHIMADSNNGHHDNSKKNTSCCQSFLSRYFYS